MSTNMLMEKLADLTGKGARYAESHRKMISDVTFKAPDNHHPVTDVDLYVGKMFGDELAEERAQGLFLVEEEHLVLGETPDFIFGKAGKTGHVLLVDPVDGTKGFIAGNADYGTMCSLIEGNKVIFAQVTMPIAGTTLLVTGRRAGIMYADYHLRPAVPAGQGKPVARLAQLDEPELRKIAEKIGLDVEVWHSGAGMATSLALGTSSFGTFPSVASWWDPAPCFALAEVTGHVLYFASAPDKVLNIRAAVGRGGDGSTLEGVRKAWQLGDTVICSTEDLRQAYMAAM